MTSLALVALLEVVLLQRAQLRAVAEVPHAERHVAELHLLHVEAWICESLDRIQLSIERVFFEGFIFLPLCFFVPAP